VTPVRRRPAGNCRLLDEASHRTQGSRNGDVGPADKIENMCRSSLVAALFCCVPLPCVAALPKFDVVSLLTLVNEQDQIENPAATLSGKVAAVSWRQIRIERLPNGEEKEVSVSSRLTKYDNENRAIEVIENNTRETRITHSYENGLLMSTRERNFTADGKPVGDEFWETYQYAASGQLVDFKRGRGQNLENHDVSKYDTAGHLVRREIRQGVTDAVVYIEQYAYSGKPETVKRRILILTSGAARDSGTFRFDEKGSVAELWTEDGYHVRWKYDDQHRVTEQSTDPYTPPSGCDECPLLGAIRTSYEDNIREQTFFQPGGKAVLQRVTVQRDGSIASIRYKRPTGARTEDAPDVNRIVGAITHPRGEPYVITTWDDHGNWTEKKQVFQPSGGPLTTMAVYRRTINYR
jgi:hypothetical protein